MLEEVFVGYIPLTFNLVKLLIGAASKVHLGAPKEAIEPALVLDLELLLEILILVNYPIIGQQLCIAHKLLVLLPQRADQLLWVLLA